MRILLGGIRNRCKLWLAMSKGSLLLAALRPPVGVALGLAALHTTGPIWADQSEKPVPRIIAPRRPVAETLSSSKQFLALGSTQEERAQALVQAESIRDEFTSFIDRQEPGATDTNTSDFLVINLWLQAGTQPPVQPRLFVLEGQPAPTLGLVLASAAHAATTTFRDELIRLLLMERLLRGNLDLDFTRRSEVLPPWLYAGVKEALDYRRLGRPSSRFAAMFNTGMAMTIEEVLQTDPQQLPAPQREIFNLSACSLVLLLHDQPQGAARFRQFLASLLRQNTAYETQLVRAFPGLALSSYSLEKWWTLQSALLAQPSIYEKLSVGDTEQKLVKALVVRWQPPKPESSAGALTQRAARASTAVGKWFKKWLPGGKDAFTAPEEEAAVAEQPAATPAEATELPEVEVIPLQSLDNFVRVASLPVESRRPALHSTQLELASLALEAHPLYQPVLDGYQQVLGFLMEGKTEPLAAILETLTARRVELRQIAEVMEDYLNWYEATQRQGWTGAFDNYFRLLEQISQPPPRQPDPFSAYLDEMEEEFAK